MTRQRCAEADQIAPAQFVQRAQQMMLRSQPPLIFRNYRCPVAVASNDEWIAPFRTAADVDRIARQPNMVAIEDMAHVTLRRDCIDADALSSSPSPSHGVELAGSAGGSRAGGRWGRHFEVSFEASPPFRQQIRHRSLAGRSEIPEASRCRRFGVRHSLRCPKDQGPQRGRMLAISPSGNVRRGCRPGLVDQRGRVAALGRAARCRDLRRRHFKTASDVRRVCQDGLRRSSAPSPGEA